MDYSTIILNYLHDPLIRSNLNPLVYTGLKIIYKPEFKKRCRYFARALEKFYSCLGNTLDISLFDESAIKKEKDKTLNDSLLIELNYPDQTNNSTMNRQFLADMSNMFSEDWRWCLENLLDYDDEYILDKEDDYIMLKMLRQYLFSDEDAKSSQLLLSYKLFVSSVELIFCFKLVENFPKSYFNPREVKKCDEHANIISLRVKQFYNQFANLYKKKTEDNEVIKFLLGNHLSSINESSFIDLTSLTMIEPLLNYKYISFTKLIKEGPFCYEIEEVARQICLLDHEMLCSLNFDDYNTFIVKREAPLSFEKFSIREKQLKCYILIFILMHNNLENKKNMIQNFISLAYTCKMLKNYQTSHTIISAFYIVGLAKKKLLWKLIEKKYREIYTSLEKDYNEMEMTEVINFDDRDLVFPAIPHITKIKTTINNFIIKLKMADEEQKSSISKDYKDFQLSIREMCKIKFSFFKLNPLYDFLKFGFLEVFKPKKWNLRLKVDLSQFTENVSQLDQLIEFLIAHFKKLDN